MMDVRWVVKTTPGVKMTLTGAAESLAEAGRPAELIAARLLVEVFDLKRTDYLKECGV